jgi:hypothetical protein
MFPNGYYTTSVSLRSEALLRSMGLLFLLLHSFFPELRVSFITWFLSITLKFLLLHVSHLYLNTIEIE